MLNLFVLYLEPWCNFDKYLMSALLDCLHWLWQCGNVADYHSANLLPSNPNFGSWSTCSLGSNSSSRSPLRMLQTKWRYKCLKLTISPEGSLALACLWDEDYQDTDHHHTQQSLQKPVEWAVKKCLVEIVILLLLEHVASCFCQDKIKCYWLAPCWDKTPASSVWKIVTRFSTSFNYQSEV